MTATTTDAFRVLLADDQPDVLDALRLLLHPEGIVTEAARSPAAVLDALAARPFDVLLMDLNYARDTTSGREGLDLLANVRAIDPALPVVVMTGWATLEVAIEALQHGARDLVQKPWENDRVVASVLRHADQRRAARRQAERKAREMEEARRIQQNLLPRELPALAGWDMAARSEPAENVGGDTFDVIQLDERRLAVSLGDVSGKGVPAALLAANLQAAVRGSAAGARSPAALCSLVNRALCAVMSPGQFVTFFYAVIDTRTGDCVYSNAGHLPPLVVRRDGRVTRLDRGGLVLGVTTEAVYAEDCVRLGAGDRLLIYTDGLTEAMAADGEEFGEARLASTLAGLAPDATGRTPAAALLGLVFERVRAFSAPSPGDDRTALAVLRTL